MKSTYFYALGACLFLQIPNLTAQSKGLSIGNSNDKIVLVIGDKSDTLRLYQAPYWKVKRLYTIALGATLCDSLARQQQNEIRLLERKQIASDSLLANTEAQFKIAVAKADNWQGRYNNQLNTVSYYERKAKFWQVAGIAAIVISVLIAAR